MFNAVITYKTYQLKSYNCVKVFIYQVEITQFHFYALAQL